MNLARGSIVDAADGRAGVVWGVTGSVAHLMPIAAAPASNSLRVELTREDGERVALYVNAADRRHLPLSALSVIGVLPDSAIADLVADVSEQRARAQRAANGIKRSAIAAARAARLRRATA